MRERIGVFRHHLEHLLPGIRGHCLIRNLGLPYPGDLSMNLHLDTAICDTCLPSEHAHQRLPVLCLPGESFKTFDRLGVIVLVVKRTQQCLARLVISICGEVDLSHAPLIPRCLFRRLCDI